MLSIEFECDFSFKKEKNLTKKDVRNALEEAGICVNVINNDYVVLDESLVAYKYRLTKTNDIVLYEPVYIELEDSTK